MSAESIAEQIEIITANVCPGTSDPARCETGIRANWEAIGNYILRTQFKIYIVVQRMVISLLLRVRHT